ncbi:hypothetical protein N4T77_03835 [Clostridium sp. CX1]|uniref:YhfM-like domain-containing protein n=1 Tax=Clostridium tanneri TaxID=3037988 RepID=A0ABU4JWC2_9CLOT|nr:MULTISPECIES: hypothetical protein [unclassified Clostridium]MCT8975725.1 hypothetical protein [Clostridium sp. CX1]MDW8802442.1 hypothetical protein [Clostridium sp. A1-XYC3]
MFSSGCTKLDDMKVKLGIKNTDFEYIKQGKIEKIVIQSTRDQGFRFIVTDKKAISELYDILSNAKAATTKSSLEPDYVFEMIEGNKVHKFSYVAGLDKKESGNLYSDNKIYIVSKRIDNDIIKSFWTIRKPKDFSEVYYSSIIDALSQYLKGKEGNTNVGINLRDDVESGKFILSTDLEDFKNNLNNKFKSVKIADKDKENYDVWVTIKTQGYKSTLYKSIITFWDKNEKSEKKFYVFDKYENGRWSIKVSEEKPDGF